MKKLTILTSLCVISVVAGCASTSDEALFAELFHPGRTIEETAYILVHDRKFGGRATHKAIQHGDAILPLIQKESENFSRLDNRNSYWIADVLGAIQTDRSRALLSDLYTRTNMLSRATGAVGLAQHGVLPDPIDEDLFLVRNVRAARPTTMETLGVAHEGPSDEEIELSIIALGWTKDEKALPCLLALLKIRPIAYWYHAYSCEALARIGSKQAIPVLRDCLRSEQFYALPSAFRTLIALGDPDAVPLAIARVTPEIKDNNSGFVVRELQRVTGKLYGYDQARWQKWWRSAQDKWQIPEEFTKPWDQQECMY